MVLLRPEHGRGRNLHLRLYSDDTPALYQLQTLIGRAYAAESHDLPLPEHNHRRSILVHHNYANDASDQLLPRRRNFCGLPVLALVLQSRQDKRYICN